MEPVPHQQVAISFKKGYNKCLFLAKIIQTDRYELAPGNSIPVINVYAPDHIEKIQRRAFKRADGPQDDPVTVTFKLTEIGDDSEQHQGQLLNLSAGGLAMTMKQEDAPELHENEQLVLTFVPLPDHEPICITARVRHARYDEPLDRVVIGTQFIGLDVTEKGRATIRKISRVVGVYLRRQPIAEHRQWLSSS